MNIDKIIKYRGRIDRQRDRDEEEHQGLVKLEPRTALEKLITESYDAVRKAQDHTVDGATALSWYLSARENRHDVWVNYLSQNNLVRGAVFGDISFSSFVKDRLNDYTELPDNIKNKTPDILFLDERNMTIVIGDVAVSNVVEVANKNKYEKYLPIAQYLKSKGYQVHHMNLVMDSELSNSTSELNKFVRMGIIQDSPDNFTRACVYHETCQLVMQHSPEKCIDIGDFYSMLNDVDSVRVVDEDIELTESFRTCKLEHHEAIRSEDELAEELKNATDERVNTGYFSCTTADIELAFDKIINPHDIKQYKVPKSILKVVANCHEHEKMTGYELMSDYVTDILMGPESEVKNLFLDLLPNTKQITGMKNAYSDKEDSKDKYKKYKEDRVYGPNQFDMSRNTDNLQTRLIISQLQKGKKNRNAKSAPTTLNPSEHGSYIEDVNNYINYLGKESSKPPFLDDSWDAKTNFEYETSKTTRELYNKARKTNGAQLCQAMSCLYQKIVHLRANAGKRDNIYVPPNGAFIALIPNEHAPVTSKNCDLPFLFITRETKDQEEGYCIDRFNEHEYSYDSDNYRYYLSKLCRLDINKISHWDQCGYKHVSDVTYITTASPSLTNAFSEVSGLFTILLLDSHQKTSLYLDLLKYVSFMPFAELSRLNVLIEDKFNLMLKTRFDVWLLHKMKAFIMSLSDTTKMGAKKPKLHMFNGVVTRESLGLDVSLPAFCNQNIRHGSLQEFVEEITMINTVRPKHLYGSQFLDKAVTAVADWNLEYEHEVEKYGAWVTEGIGDGKFPFGSDFAFDKSAIIHSTNYRDKHVNINPKDVRRKLGKVPLNTYMHYNCSLRGCTKHRSERSNLSDLHTTSMEAVLKHYSIHGYNEPDCTVQGVVEAYKKKGHCQQFTMSEKDQRGDGRPIATPDLGTKATLMMIEKPEQAVGTYTPNNILVEGKHKLSAQAECYKRVLSKGATEGKKQVYQITEDQSKFSEKDNIKKFYSYIAVNNLLPTNIRIMQQEGLKMLEKREHLVHKMPAAISKNPELCKYRNEDLNGIKVIIGWPQGMLNNIATSIHCNMDYWITYMYNKSYPDDKIVCEGLVHSDDSWATVACNSIESLERFVIYRILAKRYACLKSNEKKIYMSKLLGELVSNININGAVHLPISKIFANCFNNLTYQSWANDVSSQVSSIQQAYRSGAKVPMLIGLATILRQQIVGAYQVKGLQKSFLSVLPVELGGYPDTSVFELGVTGVNSYYVKILEYVKSNPTSDASKIVMRTLTMSSIYKSLERESQVDPMYMTGLLAELGENVMSKLVPDRESREKIEEDFANAHIPSRGEVFSCIRHILPKSVKLAQTLARVRELPFKSDGLEMIITKPSRLSVSLGHLKEQINTKIYELAAEHYTQNARRLAVSQVLQSSGKIVRLLNFRPMTINELLETVLSFNQIRPTTTEKLELAVSDDTNVSTLSNMVVYRSNILESDDDKRKIINRMPSITDKFSTLCKLRNVLLYIIDHTLGTNYLADHAKGHEPLDMLRMDANLLKRRFEIYFSFYDTKTACNLIMQQFIFRTKTRLWMQPYLRSETLASFLEDLYGKSVSCTVNYKVNVDLSATPQGSKSDDIIDSLYSIAVLNELYPGKFKVSSLNNKSISESLDQCEPAELTQMQYLKYAILKKVYLGTDENLKDYDSQKMYDQHFVKAQQYVNRRYVGEFDAVIRYGRTVIRVVGEPEDLVLTVNRPNIPDILQGMYIFVLRNFPYYSYDHHTGWARSAFWSSKTPFGQLYLTNYIGCVSLITQNRSITSIPMRLNENLRFTAPVTQSNAIRFEIDPGLRVVYKVTINSRIKIGYVHQSMRCPLRNAIILEPEWLDGLENQDLIRTNVLLNMTVGRYYHCDRNEIRLCLSNRLGGSFNTPFGLFYMFLINEFSKLNRLVEEYEEVDMPNIETIQITGETAFSMVEKYEETEPEDLQYVELEYIITDVEKHGRIIEHKSLYRTLCGMLCKKYNDEEWTSIISLILHDEKIAEHIVEQLNSDPGCLENQIEDLLQMADLMQVPEKLIYIIISNNMDKESGWSRVNMDLATRSKLKFNDTKVYDIAECLISSLMLNIVGESEVKPQDKLLSILRSKK